MELGNTAGFFRFADACRLGCLAVGLLLGGCSHAVRKEIPPPAPPARQAPLIGIASCDAYLDSYVACHRTAGIYDPSTLQTHYQAMRASLLQDASDPHERPYLANRCIGLTQQLNAALKGRSCTTPSTHNGPASH
jgi:hypothetical protein